LTGFAGELGYFPYVELASRVGDEKLEQTALGFGSNQMIEYVRPLHTICVLSYTISVQFAKEFWE